MKSKSVRIIAVAAAVVAAGCGYMSSQGSMLSRSHFSQLSRALNEIAPTAIWQRLPILSASP